MRLSTSNKASERPGGQRELGAIQLAVTPATLARSWAWLGAPMLWLSRELVFRPFAAPLASPCGRQCTELPEVIKWLSPKLMEFICE